MKICRLQSGWIRSYLLRRRGEHVQVVEGSLVPNTQPLNNRYTIGYRPLGLPFYIYCLNVQYRDYFSSSSSTWVHNFSDFNFKMAEILKNCFSFHGMNRGAEWKTIFFVLFFIPRKESSRGMKQKIFNVFYSTEWIEARNEKQFFYCFCSMQRIAEWKTIFLLFLLHVKNRGAKRQTFFFNVFRYVVLGCKMIIFRQFQK